MRFLTLALLVAIAGCGKPPESRAVPAAVPTPSAAEPPRFERLQTAAVVPVPPWEPEEVFAIHWPDGRTAQLIVEQAPVEDNPRFRISQPGVPDYLLIPPGGVVELKHSLPPELLKRNAIGSDYVFAPREFRSADPGLVLMVTGWPFNSDPGSFYALSLSPGQAPRQFFTSETFDLTDLDDLDHDGLTELVGRLALGEGWGKCFTSYVPFTVYRLPPDRVGQAERSLPLSESYTRAHYYGWVGPESSGDWAIVLCAPGGPKIMKTADAERLFNK